MLNHDDCKRDDHEVNEDSVATATANAHVACKSLYRREIEQTGKP